MSEGDEFETLHLPLGYVAGAHGVRGGLKIKLFNPDSTAIDVGVSLVFRLPDGPARTFVVSEVSAASGAGVLRVWLDGVDDRDAADALRAHQLWIERAELPALADDEYYLADLVGLEVVRERDGVSASLGRITGVTSNTAQDLLCVRLRGREWLLPALPPFIVAIEAQRVLVDVHDDMLPDMPDVPDEPDEPDEPDDRGPA
jgi:16S rRNA processing protein RimM